MTLNDKRWNIF